MKRLGFIVSILILSGLWSEVSARTEIDELQAGSSGADVVAVRADVEALADLAQRHLQTVGVKQALQDFLGAPWHRNANALHLWGVTTRGMHWFDVGHPEIIGLDVSQMADIEGRLWFDLAIASASGDGPATFEMHFPHPNHGRAALNINHCFFLEDRERVLCAGGYED